MNKTTLLILAGGMGSRYKGQKQVDAVSAESESLMEFALYDALKHGIRQFVLIVNAQFPKEYKAHLTQIITEKKAELHFVEQTIDKFIPEEFHLKLKDRNKPLGTAHAVLCAKEIIKGPFITMNADDFYGGQSFEIAQQAIEKSQDFGIIAFQLKNTLSKNGSVSRGLCQIENQYLKSVEEFTEIQATETVLKGKNENRESKTLNPEDWVSMNFWVLNPKFFEFAERDLLAFLNQHQDLSKVEFYLPSVIDKAIHQNEVKVRISESPEKWMGLTYPNDKELVINEIEDLKEAKIYPENLWK